MEKGDAYWGVIEPIWNLVNIYDGEEIFFEQFLKITPTQGALFSTHWCQSEVRNGGFYQFFYNNTGVLAPEAVTGFKAIGMVETAGIVLQAMNFFGSNYPRELEKRRALLPMEENELDDLESDPFESFDDSFFELIDNEIGGFLKAADHYSGLR